MGVGGEEGGNEVEGRGRTGEGCERVKRRGKREKNGEGDGYKSSNSCHGQYLVVRYFKYLLTYLLTYGKKPKSPFRWIKGQEKS